MKKEKVSSRVKAHTRYKLADGTIVPGASTISGIRDKSFVLTRWANKLGLQGIDSTKFVDEKAEIGTLGHYLILCHLTKVTPDLKEYSQAVIDKAENCFLSYLNWEKQHTIEPLHCEANFVSEKFKFGGCVDMVAKVDGKVELVDFKTGKAIYDNYFVQLAGYEILLIEHGIKIKGRRILNIPRIEDEMFNERSESDKRIAIYSDIFFSLLDVYYSEKQLKKEA